MLDCSREGSQCSTDCAGLFDRVRIYPRITGGTRVEWILNPTFDDPEPYQFQLQVGNAATADDWENVGAPAADTYWLVDPEQRVLGKTQWTHYRIRLETERGVYYSTPELATGSLDFRLWRQTRAISRAWSVQLRHQMGVDGYLLKRRLKGTACSCLDMLTHECRNPQCEECFGTGYVSGYYPAEPCIWVALSERLGREHLDSGQARGTTNDVVVSGKMLATPQVMSYDVWVDHQADVRYVIHSVRSLVELRRVPVVVQVEMRPAPFSDPVYNVPLE